MYAELTLARILTGYLWKACVCVPPPSPESDCCVFVGHAIGCAQDFFIQLDFYKVKKLSVTAKLIQKNIL